MKIAVQNLLDMKQVICSIDDDMFNTPSTLVIHIGTKTYSLIDVDKIHDTSVVNMCNVFSKVAFAYIYEKEPEMAKHVVNNDTVAIAAVLRRYMTLDYSIILKGRMSACFFDKLVSAYPEYHAIRIEKERLFEDINTNRGPYTAFGYVLNKGLAVYSNTSAPEEIIAFSKYVHTLYHAGLKEVAIIRDAVFTQFLQTITPVITPGVLGILFNDGSALGPYTTLLALCQEEVYPKLLGIQAVLRPFLLEETTDIPDPHLLLTETQDILHLLRSMYDDLWKKHTDEQSTLDLNVFVSVSVPSVVLINTYNTNRKELLRLRTQMLLITQRHLLTPSMAIQLFDMVDHLADLDKYSVLSQRDTHHNITLSFLWLCHMSDEKKPCFPAALGLDYDDATLEEYR